MKRVILYYHLGCGHCRAAEEFLRHKGIAFEKRNIQIDPHAYNELVTRWNSRSAVTLVIENEVIIGLQRNRERLERLLP
jgi:glutaredoxin